MEFGNGMMRSFDLAPFGGVYSERSRTAQGRPHTSTTGASASALSAPPRGAKTFPRSRSSFVAPVGKSSGVWLLIGMATFTRQTWTL